MDVLHLKFGENNYDIHISEERILIGGCDCIEIMPDTIAIKVYEKLYEYLRFKGLINE